MILETLEANGFKAFLAGGCVRDTLLGRYPKDADVATDAKPEEVLNLFPGSKYVGEAFGVVLVPTPFGSVEVATFRVDGFYSDGRHPDSVRLVSSPEQDASRRDFTINGLFMDRSGRVFDFVGGQEDLKQGVIRAIGDPFDRFTEDALRMLRAIRFACRFNFGIHEETLNAIRVSAPTILGVSWERIGAEVVAAFIANPRDVLFLLETSGLLQYVLPEIAAMKGVTQDKIFHPEGDVFEHTFLVLDYLSRLPISARDEISVMAALLHDIAKPATRSEAGDCSECGEAKRQPSHNSESSYFTHSFVPSRVNFLRHELEGVIPARRVLTRLRRPVEVREGVGWIIENHLKPFWAESMRMGKLKRILRHEHGRRLLNVAWADAMGGYRGNMRSLRFCRDLLRRPEKELVPPRFVTGHDLIALGLQPGPKFKTILDEVETAQLEGQLDDRETALTFVRGMIQPTEPL